jgi:5-hydroxytryptamine receptor 2
MCIISLDRYLGISHPLKVRNRSTKIVAAKIIGVWLITILISSPIALLALVNRQNIFFEIEQTSTASTIDTNNKHTITKCQIDNPYYMIYGSTLAFLIPLLIMIVCYFRTTALLREQTLALAGGCAQQMSTTTTGVNKAAAADGLRRTMVSRSQTQRTTR